MVQYCVVSWAMVGNGMGGRGVAVAVWVRWCEVRLGAAWRGEAVGVSCGHVGFVAVMWGLFRSGGAWQAK